MLIIKRYNWYILKKFNFKKFKLISLKLKDIDTKSNKPERILCFSSKHKAREFIHTYNAFNDITEYYFNSYLL